MELTEQELVVRTVAEPRRLLSAVRQAAQSVDPALPRFEVATVADRLAEEDRPRRFQTKLLGIFAGLALILAATGLYGLMAYSVQQRTKEIGIRVALGATRAGIARLVIIEGMAWGIGGIGIGLGGAIAFGRALSGSLFGVGAGDPMTLGVVIAALAAVMVAASAWPALCASRVDAMVALREE